MDKKEEMLRGVQAEEQPLLSPTVLAQINAPQIQQQFGELVRKQLRRYTMGDSSSAPEETVRQLLESVIYTVGSAGEQGLSDALVTRGVETVFLQGRQRIEEKVKLGKKLLFRAQMTRLNIDNLAYADTYDALAEFFKQYDLRFFAQEVPCMIDYQLSGGQPTGHGIDYINEYLARLAAENDFCRRFDIERVRALLRVYVPDYREQIINLYEPILANALGRVLADSDPLPLDIPPEMGSRIHALLAPLTGGKRGATIGRAARQLAQTLSLPDEMQVYILSATDGIVARLDAADSREAYGNVFLSFAIAK